MIFTRKLVWLGVFAIGFVGCGQKAEQPKVEQVQVPDSNAAYAQYTQEINGLSQVGIETTTGKYPISTINKTTFDSTVAGLKQRIYADPAIEGTDVAGKKRDLLGLLATSAATNSPFLREGSLNKKVNEEIRTLLVDDPEAMTKDPELFNIVAAKAGISGMTKLGSSDSNERSRVAYEMFP